jgi:YndJ-like protein
VPLGLRLVHISGRRAARLLLVARVLQPAGALAAILSFWPRAGLGAALLALGWLAVCAVAGLAGLAEVIESRSVRPAHLLPAGALGFLTVGGAWFVAYRAGISLGYATPIVELTAVHFHYAGFAATLMSALAFSALRSRPCAAAGLLVIFGTPLTATGIATGVEALTVIGPILLAGGLLTNAGLTAFLIAPRLPGRARWLLTISSLAVVVPMLLGVDYAAARVLPIPALDLRTMAIVHGDLNAIFYALFGLAGWSLA